MEQRLDPEDSAENVPAYLRDNPAPKQLPTLHESTKRGGALTDSFDERRQSGSSSKAGNQIYPTPYNRPTTQSNPLLSSSKTGNNNTLAPLNLAPEVLPGEAAIGADGLSRQGSSKQLTKAEERYLESSSPTDNEGLANSPERGAAAEETVSTSAPAPEPPKAGGPKGWAKLKQNSAAKNVGASKEDSFTKPRLSIRDAVRLHNEMHGGKWKSSVMTQKAKPSNGGFFERQQSLTERMRGKGSEGELAAEWEKHCMEVGDPDGGLEKDFTPRLWELGPPFSMRNLANTKASAINLKMGTMDPGELRRKGGAGGSFYSLFTPAGIGMAEPTGEGKATSLYMQVYTFFLFMFCGLFTLMCRMETVLLVVLGGASTFVCVLLDLRLDYEKGPIFIGLIFPLSFLIQQNWSRREKAIDRLAMLRANGIQLVLKVLTGSGSGVGSRVKAIKVVKIVRALITEVSNLLPQDTTLSGPRLVNIYGLLADLQNFPECALLTRFMLVEFEKLRTQRDYRSPWGLTYFCFMFTFASPVLLSPVFAAVGCRENKETLELVCEDKYGSAGAYISNLFFALLMGALLTVVKDLEDPFDFQGFDDVLVQFDNESNALLFLITYGRYGKKKEKKGKGKKKHEAGDNDDEDDEDGDGNEIESMLRNRGHSKAVMKALKSMMLLDADYDVDSGEDEDEDND